MGEVYRAKDAKLGREIAVKVLPSATASDPDRRQRFEMEARSASALNHPNILTIYDIGEADGTVYIAMELVEGKTLRELVASRRARADEEASRRRRPDGGRPRQGALGRHRPPGPEAREHHGLEGRLREDPRLRPRQADRGAFAGPVGRSDGDRGADAARNRHGNGRLHVARAGERSARRLPLRPVHPRRDPLRDGDGQAGLPAKDRRGDARRDHPRGARAALSARAEGPRPRALDRRAPARQGPRGALRLDQGPRARPQERARPPDGDLVLRRARAGRAGERSAGAAGSSRRAWLSSSGTGIGFLVRSGLGGKPAARFSSSG